MLKEKIDPNSSFFKELSNRVNQDPERIKQVKELQQWIKDKEVRFTHN